MTVKLLLLIYGCLDGRALRVGKPISSSARCHAFYSSLRKVHKHFIANCLSIISSALVVQVVQRATCIIKKIHVYKKYGFMPMLLCAYSYISCYTI